MACDERPSAGVPNRQTASGQVVACYTSENQSIKIHLGQPLTVSSSNHSVSSTFSRRARTDTTRLLYRVTKGGMSMYCVTPTNHAINS